MSFGHPLLLLTLLLIPAGLLAYHLVQRRRRMRYAVRYTNVDVLASVLASGRPWRRWLATGAFLLALATLCIAVTRPRIHRLVPNENATVVLVLDVSGSMQAVDVKPTRLVAAQRAMHEFLKRVPSRLKVGLILFAGEAQVATPPTTDHELVSEAIDEVDFFHGFGGTAIGDAIAAAVRVGLRSAGVNGQSVSAAPSQQSRQLASYIRASTVTASRRVAASPHPASTLVSVLFLSDGHQTRGVLTPLQGAERAKAAGIPIYTVALGTTGNTSLRGFPGGGGGSTGGGFSFGFGQRGLAPDPKTLRAIATTTGGKFYRARSAGAVKEAYSSLGSKLGRTSGTEEVTSWFAAGAALLLVAAGVLAAFWGPRLP
jgi:Ca-activated chloride channel homolog